MTTGKTITLQTILPQLRADLELSIAPNEEKGQPVWMLHDPVHATFTRIDWVQFEIIRRLDRPQSLQDLCKRLATETSIREPESEILDFLQELIRHGLTTQTLHKSTGYLEAEKRLQQTGILKWLIFHYLYFRIPLLHPDRFLEKSMGIARILSSQVLLLLYLLLSFGGLYFLSQHFDEYIHTFTSFLNPKGIVLYAVSIAILKSLHEFSHAYTAKYYGNRVPTMGLAFIVLWPIPFCDVTDSWRMNSRKKRIRISAAGIITELVIAGIALFIWGSTSNPSLKSITFIFSSVSLISTLLVNLNPLMRFDGYYIFSDLTGIDNLQLRAFTLTRWFYRHKLLGMKVECPEPELSFKRKFFMLVYSVCTWIYRFFLYTGIAVVVYYTFPKIIGIGLFGIEIVIFLIRPLYNELTTDFKLLYKGRISLRFALFLILLCCLLLWFCLPLSRYNSIPAIVATDNLQIIYSPTSGVISEQYIRRGSIVQKGKKLLIIESQPLLTEITLSRLNLRLISDRMRQISAKPGLREFLPELRETYLQAKARLRSLEERLKHNTIYADLNGTVTDYKDTLTPGVAVYTGEELGRIYDLQSSCIKIYASSLQSNNFQLGDTLEFIPNYASLQNIRFPVRITGIKPTREEFLHYPQLASVNGGDIDVIPDRQGRLKMIHPYYELECSFIQNSGDAAAPAPAYPRFDQPGRVVFWSRPRSYAKSLLLQIYHILIRESGI